MPIRKVSQHGKNIIGLFPSMKLCRMVAYESLVERDAYLGFDYDRLVTHFEEQPRRIDYFFGGKEHFYTPDIWVVRAGENILFECKPKDFVDTTENRIKFAAAREWCAAEGWLFEVLVAEQLRAGFRLENIRVMTLYARHEVPDEFCQGARECLANGPILLGDLAAQLPCLAWLMCLGFRGQIEIAIDSAPLGPDSVVSLGGAK